MTNVRKPSLFHRKPLNPRNEEVLYSPNRGLQGFLWKIRVSEGFPSFATYWLQGFLWKMRVSEGFPFFATYWLQGFLWKMKVSEGFPSCATYWLQDFLWKIRVSKGFPSFATYWLLKQDGNPSKSLIFHRKPKDTKWKRFGNPYFSQETQGHPMETLRKPLFFIGNPPIHRLRNIILFQKGNGQTPSSPPPPEGTGQRIPVAVTTVL